MPSVEENVKAIIVDQLGANEADVSPDAHFIDDLGADSLDTVELVMKFEEDFDIEIPDEDAEKIQTVQDAIDYINSHRAAAILTVEDPIEVLHPDKRSVVVQREIGVDTPDFAEAVRGALRHDTDVIVVSEIDDLPTANAAISAAETGHLVISSMRTTDPADTLSRLVSFFPESKQQVFRGQVAAQLNAILSQRLIETKDTGRVLACEVLINTERTQEWILGGAAPGDLVGIIQDSEFFGMQTFDQAILKLVVERVVDVPTAIPHTRNVHEMRAKALAAGIQI